MIGKVRLIDDLSFVVFDRREAEHSLDPERRGQTICGLDVDPWSVSFLPRGPKQHACVRCIAGRMRRARKRLADQRPRSRRRGMIRER